MDLLAVPDIVKFLATLGVGGALAALIFWFYRKDSIEHARSWQGQSEALLQVVKDNTSAVVALQQTTAALQATIEALRADMNDRDRITRLREERDR